MADDKAILVIGAGDATGGAIAKHFAKEGYIACVTRRTVDKLQPQIDEIRTEGGEANGFGSDARKEDRETAKVMLPRGLRHHHLYGRNGPLARTRRSCRIRRRKAWAANWAPEGIHVAHPVIDAAIDTALIRDNLPERYALKGEDGIVQSSSITNAYWNLHQQSCDAGRRDGAVARDGNVLRPKRANRRFQLRFHSLFTDREAFVFPCNVSDHVVINALSERARSSDLFAPATVGRFCAHGKSLPRRSSNWSWLDEFEALGAMAP